MQPFWFIQCRVNITIKISFWWRLHNSTSQNLFDYISYLITINQNVFFLRLLDTHLYNLHITALYCSIIQKYVSSKNEFISKSIKKFMILVSTINITQHIFIQILLHILLNDLAISTLHLYYCSYPNQSSAGLININDIISKFGKIIYPFSKS